ncbi:sensor histidine kinase [Roseateles amylovorans]|uniref:Histidine kinase n=1 Tax=Roseateles amylovorans TaxID=2978473 RepID=A0ABY6B3Q0_9BURK|nr:histidine kinase [Roseateles amylovorans]UXH78153.1 histidine kinase [Roseateles amylovorans]
MDRLLARIAQPAFVLRIAALAVCLLELASAVWGLMGNPTEPYDGMLASLYRRLGGDTHDAPFVLACLALVTLFAWHFWRLARQQHLDLPPRNAMSRVLLLDLLALTVTPGLPFLVTVLAALLLNVRKAFGFALAQVVINVALYWLLPSEAQRAEQLQNDLPWWLNSLGLAISMVALHGMAFGLGRLAAAEAERRRWFQAMLAEKDSGERLQVEQLRYAERMSMARELHDVMGHHLTALNLHLQLSDALLKRHDESGAAQAVEKARLGAAGLLAEVRAAVSRERESQRINLEAALRTLAEGIASTPIELTLDPVAQDLSPRCAHALLRCVQEAVTNAVRHAGATRVQVSLDLVDGADATQVRVRVDDNGRGTRKLREGNGLKGMQERMAELGGTMQVLRHHPGFLIELNCPRHA